MGRRDRVHAKRFALGVVALGLVTAAAACTPTKPPAPGPTQELVTFECTKAPATWTVPAGVTAVDLEVRGAPGDEGVGLTPGFPGMGGNGAQATATMTVTPGQVLNIEAGCEGSEGGWPTGGAGGVGTSPNGGGVGGTGGGSSVVADSGGQVLVVAGGGGGGASATCPGGGMNVVTGGAGGNGGGVLGVPGGNGLFGASCPGDPVVTGGGGGDTINGVNGTGGQGAGGAGNGDSGHGAFGGKGGANAASGGGGGGGGFFGGGGGGGSPQAAAGGGGGSSAAVSRGLNVLSGITLSPGVVSDHGSVLITWDG
jgi:hypothetical protein